MEQTKPAGAFRQILNALFCTLLLAMAASTALAQETTGGIKGVVTDATGAAVAGAKVEASSPALVRPISVTTDAAGAYNFPSLPPGIYTLTVTASGFTTVKQENINLQIGKLLEANLQVKVGNVAESVTITSEAPIVDVTQSKIATNVSQDFFDKLPKGRSFDSLIALAPGARSETKGGGYQIDGASGSENVFVIDGVDVTDLQHGTLPGQSRIPIEFVNEVQIKSSGFEAQYGGATGGVINTVVRSGSNEFHGQGSLYWNTDGLNGDPRPTLQLDPNDENKAIYINQKKDAYRFLNPGFSLGGPILKDKLWFFTSYYPQLNRTNRTVTFLRNNQTATFEQRNRTDFLTAKLDYAPFTKLRTYFTYLYSPNKVNGSLPGIDGSSDPSTPYKELGSRSPSSSYTFGADYTMSSRLIFSVRGGYNYRNYKDYGIPRGTPYVRYLSPSTGISGVPSNLQGPTGIFTTNNFQTVFDVQTRFNLSADVSYITNLAGQHTFRGGFQTNRLHNEVSATWPDGYFRIGWNRAYTGVTVPGKVQGAYGYIIDRVFGTFGDVNSDNKSIYIQDSWQVARRLTLNLGFRTEREFLPSFRTDSGIASRAIEFGFGDKLAPRLGFAYDVFGNSKLKVYGSFGLFYDLMKYELPRGSFGGDQWKDYVYPLDTPDWTKFKPGTVSGPGQIPGTLFEVVDWRIPSNNPNDNTIDPKLKPMRERAYDFGADYAWNDNFVFGTRYTRKRLDRTIEDVGVLTPQGEKYYIANPGFGLTADPKSFGAGIPPTPKAKRNYDAIEFRLDKRFSKNYTFSTSYTYSRLYGNYGGLASSDENGRQSPNVNRYFDLPFMSFDAKGKLVEGLLATDRPHTFKFFGSYLLKSKLGETNIAPTFFVFSGTPLTTEVQVFGVPVFANGRGDLGRTPVFSTTDLLLYHDYKIKERYKVRFEANFTNLFDQDTVTGENVSFIHPNDGGIQFSPQSDFFKGIDYNALIKSQGLRLNPQFGKANAFQGPRSIRFGVHFFF